MPAYPFPFDPIRRELYAPQELLAGFDPARPLSYQDTLDFRIYRHYVEAGKYAPRDYFLAMMQALHDNSVHAAANEFLTHCSARAVAVMGGHQLRRDDPVYEDTSRLSRALSRDGFTMLSGGGPGAMEATHLGALLSNEGDSALDEAIETLSTQPALPAEIHEMIAADGSVKEELIRGAHAWILPAHQILHSVTDRGRSLAIPTWLYAHEPGTILASHIAKYFQNSIREDSLLAIATHGVVFVRGGAGTLQEVFQDAAQNYYRTFGTFSPMVFLGSRYWSEQRPVRPLLESLFRPEDMERCVLFTDDIGEVIRFLASHDEPETPAGRVHHRLNQPD